MADDQVLAYARQICDQLGRGFDEDDDDFVRFLAHLGRDIGLRPAALRHRVRWYLTH